MDNKLGKGLVAGAMGLSLAFGATGMIVGLTAKGNPGKSAYEIAVENGFTGSEAEWLASLKGLVGDVGGQGPVGDVGGKGPSGSSVYAGYDGYIWNGSTKTDFKLEETTLADNVFEDTMSIAGVMSNYVENTYLDVTNNPVALMANYMPTIGKTQYSGITTKEIKVYSENAGTLHIGTAKVADVVSSRTTGAAFTANTTSHNVVAGDNTIAIELVVADDETIVLGGSGSTAKLFVATGLDVDDEAGNFATIDGATHTDILSTTDSTADTLAVGVYVEGLVENRVFEEDLTTMITISGATDVDDRNGPYRYNQEHFAGKHISKIGIPVKSVTAGTANPHMTVYVINKDANTAREGIIRKVRIEIERSALNGTTINNWVYATIFKDANGNLIDGIDLADNETLAFGAYSSEQGYVADTITWAYVQSTGNLKYSFRDGNAEAGTVSGTTCHNILFDVYYGEGISVKGHIAKLLAEESAAQQG